ncbi:Tyrosine-protein kinase YwqD [Pirellulimonas nuda]|uniref:Tyrosine-protein kinase YwqD n=1 Tax=Pirellulimonas nuda TaxID=2528009 RepID=A0A518DEY8_9BACT|nr:CpsD/CapB family tyrosine-protein kinase [Pirellulimonas nuda]QDU90002.1 Tyrosine-protein kinase YwqD [Pirellulimonas nuda]
MQTDSPTIDASLPDAAGISKSAESVMTPRRRGAEYYDTILWRLRSRVDQEPDGATMLGVTGYGRRNGVSTIAANLAIRAADHRMSPVLLVDANLHYPKQHRTFRMHDAAGLADVLSGSAPLEACVHPSSVDGLDVMPLGASHLLDRASVDPQRFQSLLTELRDQYRTVVFDLPEADEMRHALLFARSIDAAVFAVRSDAVRRRDAQVAVARLRADGVNLVGAVLTAKRRYAPAWLVG